MIRMTYVPSDTTSLKELEEDMSYEDKLQDHCNNLKKAVDDLIEYKNHYFEHHPISEARLKNKRIEDKVQATTELFKKYNDVVLERTLKANYYYHQGRVLNVLDDFNPTALEVLVQAIKLDAKNLDAWNILGEMYWKKGDFLDAISCFERANAINKNKESLRNLSMIYRQIPVEIPLTRGDDKSKPLQNKEKVLQGLDYAQQAVKLDPTDGTSWGVLGNAYLAEYFAFEQNFSLLKKALSAYNQSYKDAISKFNSVINYNHAVALKYAEDYGEAILKLERTIELDPNWESAKDDLGNLLQYINNIQELYDNKGKIRQKKLSAQIKSLNTNDLGPLLTIKPEYKLITLAELASGLNKDCVVLGRLIGTVSNNDGVPIVFGLVDSSEQCMMFTVYNLIKNKCFPLGAAVAVANPSMERKEFNNKAKPFKFKSVRVDNPFNIIINGERISKEFLAGTEMSVYSNTDNAHISKNLKSYMKNCPNSKIKKT